MADMAVSVLAKLKNKAKASGISYQQCLQLFFQEEFLRRLAGSKYAENFVLKGGLFIYTLTNFESRATVDVDFLMRGLNNDLARMDAIIAEILADETGNDFIQFKAKKTEPIAVRIVSTASLPLQMIQICRPGGGISSKHSAIPICPLLLS